jgi:hypothetical protein
MGRRLGLTEDSGPSGKHLRNGLYEFRGQVRASHGPMLASFGNVLRCARTRVDEIRRLITSRPKFIE